MQYLNCWSSICAPEAVHAHRAAGAWPARKDRYGNWFREWLELGEKVTSQQVADARIAYDRCTGQLNGLFSSVEGSVDVLICPAMPSPPDTGANREKRRWTPLDSAFEQTASVATTLCGTVDCSAQLTSRVSLYEDKCCW